MIGDADCAGQWLDKENPLYVYEQPFLTVRGEDRRGEEERGSKGEGRENRQEAELYEKRNLHGHTDMMLHILTDVHTAHFDMNDT